MRISDMLFETAQELWDEAAEKSFVKEMAEGSLDEGLFRRYMIQDYLYLLDYIDTLRLIQSRTDDADSYPIPRPEMRCVLHMPDNQITKERSTQANG